MISEKQHEANLRNAQHSTGPKTPESKAHVRFNALQHGPRARSTLLPDEDPEEFAQLCADLADDWHPQTRTEALLIEQMAADQWILGRLVNVERAIYYTVVNKAVIDERLVKSVALLDRLSQQKVRLQRSFSKSIRDLEHLQQQHHGAPKDQPPQTKHSAAPPAEYPAPQPEPSLDNPDALSPVSTDTR